MILFIFRGHYISIVKSHGFWLIFDDDVVDKIGKGSFRYSFSSKRWFSLKSLLLWIRNDFFQIQILLFRSFRIWIYLKPK
jgi:hypothetical protein